MKVKRGILIILAAVLLIGGGLGALSVTNYLRNTKEFVADGYILKPSEEVNVTTEVNEQYYFGQGTKYKEKYATKVLFKDKSGASVVLDTDQYLHYADGSLGSFTKGVIMNLDDLSDEQFGYYSLTKNTILVKNANVYEMSSRGEAMSLSEFIWKISDTDYMVVSPEVTLQLNESNQIILPDYAQLKYVDNGIVRIVHQQGTYQTVSADTFLRTKGGAELNLVGKSFYINGEPAVSLDSMAIDDDSYIELDENADSPELKIPTFNVINGKDGVDGTDGDDGEVGEDGEEGKEGEEGEEGTEGTEGTEGAAGAQGSNGINGADGLDGLEGDSGSMGYDGANGADGKDGTRADGTTGVVGVEVLTRPMVTMDSDSFEITPGGVKMKLNMSDSDNSLIQNSTEIKIYDRATMQEVSPPNNTWGLSLEQNGSFQIDTSNLSPDREYVIIVSGKYVSEESDTEGKEANLFTKIFKTDALGITLEKQSVTDASVTLRTLMSSSSIGNYDVVFYTYDDDGNKKMLASYPGLTGSRSDLVFSADLPADNRDTVFDVKSNTVYYASLANVTILGNSALISADGTELKIRTLKKKPYKAGDAGVLISAMQPVLTANEKSRSLTVSMDALEDPDNGIVGYRYELFKAADVAAAAASNTLSSLVPAYAQTSDTLKVQNFNLSTGDLEQYVARIVVVFDDNEKEVEYATLFSNGAGLSDATFPVVEFLQVNKTPEAGGYHETLSGYIKIKDSSNALAGNISDSYPLLLTITSEYEDVYSKKLTTTVTGPEADAGAVYYYFEQSGLRKDTPYSLSLSGPVDTDGDGVVSDAEKLTYLAGIRGTTTNTYGLRAVFTTKDDATTAFKKRLNITSGTESTIPMSFYEYEAKTMEEVQLELVHIGSNGVETVLGNPCIIKDTDADEHASIFFNGGWVDQSAVSQDGSNGLTTTAPNTGSDDKLMLTPVSFGLDNNDSVFYSGGSFVIRVKSASDYTVNHKNEIPFLSDANLVKFQIQRKHIQAADPTGQVSVGVITNENADDAYKEDKLDEETPVGLLIQANYPYTDALEITYKVFKLRDDENSPDGGNNRVNIYPAGTDPAAITDGGIAGLGELVCETTLTELQGDSGNGKAYPVKLYFKDLGSAGTLTSADKKWTNRSSESDASKVVARGGRYYITYQVKASCDTVNGLDCDNNGQPDNYPGCTYNVGEAVPYYRSKVVTAEKQIPKIQRYPWSSDGNSATWKYKIEDPDNAIILSDDGTKAQLNVIPYDSVGGAAGASRVLEVTLSDYQGSFKELKIDGLNDGEVYAVSVPYKRLTSTSLQETITSIPVQFKAVTDTAPGAVECRGRQIDPSDTTIPEADKTGGYEKALINQGGYRYRLTLRGEDITKYAALRITFTGKDAGGNTISVVYDPVYMEVQQGTMQDGANLYPYAYAYLDTSALADMKKKITGDAKVKVEGYYSTNKSGMEGYSSSQTFDGSHKDLDGEKLYAVKVLEESGKGKYVYLMNNAWITTAGNEDGSDSYLNKSLFVPGETVGDGFKETTMEGGVTVDKGTMSQRYAPVPLTLLQSDFFESKTLQLTYDENGMKDTAAVNGYLTAEELKLGGEISFRDSSDSVNLGDILPAVELIDASQGVKSLLLNFEALGTGATQNSKIYAEVMEQQGDGSYKSLKMTVAQEERDNGAGGKETIYYYNAKEADADRYAPADAFTYENYKDVTLPIQVKNGKFILPLRIRGLKADTRYHIVMFAYDSDNKRKDLYSIDGKCIAYNYEMKTKKKIEISTAGPEYIYNSYEDKSAAFGFAIPGDEGSGMQAYYSVIEKSSGNVVYAKTALEPLGEGNRKYYSQKIEENNKMTMPMKPSPTGNVLKLGTAYILRVVVEDTLDHTELGNADVEFTTPTALEEPDFYVQLSQETDSSAGAKLTANIVCTDKQHATVYNKYKVTVFKDDVEVASQEILKNSSSGTKVQTVSFTGLEQGAMYTVVVSAAADINNDGTGDKTIEKRLSINTSEGASATLGASASADTFVLTLSNLKNFTNVGKILVTAYKDGASCFNGSQSFSYSDSQDSYELRFDWGNKEAGTYEIQIQYQTADGKMLGNDSCTVKVPANGTSGLKLLNSTNKEKTDEKKKTEKKNGEEVTDEKTEKEKDGQQEEDKIPANLPDNKGNGTGSNGAADGTTDSTADSSTDAAENEDGQQTENDASEDGNAPGEEGNSSEEENGQQEKEEQENTDAPEQNGTENTQGGDESSEVDASGMAETQTAGAE